MSDSFRSDLLNIVLNQLLVTDVDVFHYLLEASAGVWFVWFN